MVNYHGVFGVCLGMYYVGLLKGAGEEQGKNSLIRIAYITFGFSAACHSNMRESKQVCRHAAPAAIIWDDRSKYQNVKEIGCT